MSDMSYRSQFPDIGPKFVEKVNALGISSREEMIELWSEAIFRRYMQLHGGWKHGMCSCLAYQFEGVIRNCKRYEIPKSRKDVLKQRVNELRKHFAEISKE